MARKQEDDDFMLDDELTAAFLSDDDNDQPGGDQPDEWMEDEALPGQLAVDVYETDENLYVVAPIAGIEKKDIEVSLSDNTLSINGTRKSPAEEKNQNFYVQECYWGEFSRSLTLPVQVKEENITAELKAGVLTIGFDKVEQNTVKKIEIK